jgi:hypothetical protein
VLYSQQADKTVSITVSGSGKTQEDAKKQAFRSAIEQAFGVFISSKTEIFNDQVVADQISSVASGNIQTFKILNESQLPNGSWGVTLNALVSVSKLTSFVESKGIVVEFKGGLFAINIKQQMINEQSEINAVAEMVGLLHEPMQISFDYVIKSSEPKSIDSENKNWIIPLEVTANANKNFEFCANYMNKTLAAISLSEEEVSSYKNMNRSVFPIKIIDGNSTNMYFLRKESSLKLLETFTSQWQFYVGLFTVSSEIGEMFGNKIFSFNKVADAYGHFLDKEGSGYFEKTSEILQFSRKPKIKYSNNGDTELEIKTIDFLKFGQEAASYKWNDMRTLSEIEKMSGYKIKPSGVISNFKYGGIVIYDLLGHGLVVSLTDLKEEMDWDSAKKAVNNLVLNGYSDWRLPSKEEFSKISSVLQKNGIGGFENEKTYWTSTQYDKEDALVQEFSTEYNNRQKSYNKGYEARVRAVRNF